MPHLKFCAAPRCSVKVRGRYCAVHQQAKRRTERRHYTTSDTISADIGRILPPARYGRQWQRESQRFLADHPFCVDCVAEGKQFGIATEVDHDIPHQGDRALFWDERNWRSRCKPHHSRKTARETWGIR